MYFYALLSIEYTMRKGRIVLFAVTLAALAAGFIVAFYRPAAAEESVRGAGVITVWQIDSFEGGKGSRAQYLRSVGSALLESDGIYVEVTALSSSAARENMAEGNLPDVISYGAGFYGLESYSDGNAVAWCRGGYCLISAESSEPPTDNNTVINSGRENIARAAAAFAGLGKADELPPTSAYVAMLSGEYKYLLGTQRDIIRLQTRGEKFTVQPLNDYNDMYQYISVLAKGEKRAVCNKFVDLLLQKNDLNRIGMLRDGLNLYSDEMHALEGVKAAYTLPPTVSAEYLDKIKSAANSADINMLKSLLKAL